MQPAEIRRLQEADRAALWPALWPVIAPVFRAGETYPTDPEISESDAREYWLETPSATYVAIDAARTLLGTYYIRPNQPTLGDHVCNCGYIVAEEARGQGLALTLCRHSQEQARALGFSAMQYNLVIATNEAAIKVWRRGGLEIIGTLPKAFRHKRLGLVDAHIMYRLLD